MLVSFLITSIPAILAIAYNRPILGLFIILICGAYYTYQVYNAR
jgi:hypothetical protein